MLDIENVDPELTPLPVAAKVTDDPSPSVQIPHPGVCCLIPDPTIPSRSRS
jgi:hypothetical protein